MSYAGRCCENYENADSVNSGSRDAGPVSAKRRWKPRDTVLRGVRVEKKQVNSVSRLRWERVASLYFTYLVISIPGSGAISGPKSL